jgi:hypothetical protein
LCNFVLFLLKLVKMLVGAHDPIPELRWAEKRGMRQRPVDRNATMSVARILNRKQDSRRTVNWLPKQPTL